MAPLSNLTKATSEDQPWMSGSVVAVVKATALVGMVAVLDAVTGADLRVSFLYMAAVVIATWSAGRNCGVAMALLSTALAIGIGEVQGHPYASQSVFWFNSAGDGIGYLVAVILTDSVRQLLGHQAVATRADHHTGLPNRAALIDELDAEILRFGDYARPFSVLAIGISGFDDIRRARGEAEAERLALGLSMTLTDNTKSSDLVGRIAPDLFVALLYEIDGAKARRVAERLLEALDASLDPASGPIAMAAGIVSVERDRPTGAEQLAANADDLLNAARRGGSDRVVQTVI